MQQAFNALPIHTDYGPIGEGASQAHVVLATNGTEYLVKGPCFTPGHQFVAVNKFISALLADQVGLPVLDSRLIDVNGHLCFGSHYLPRGSFYPHITADLLAQCVNRECVYKMVVFDAWILNTDRHSGNLLVRVSTPRGAQTPEHFLLLNDHSHALVPPGEQCQFLASRIAEPVCTFVHLDFIAAAITSSARLDEALRKIESFTDQMIDATLAVVPMRLWPDVQCRNVIHDFLRQRRDCLRSLFRQAQCFPNLEGSVP
jgi:hypothetical protein